MCRYTIACQTQEQWLCRVWLPISPPRCSTQDACYRKWPPDQWPDFVLVHSVRQTGPGPADEAAPRYRSVRAFPWGKGGGCLLRERRPWALCLFSQEVQILSETLWPSARSCISEHLPSPSTLWCIQKLKALEKRKVYWEKVLILTTCVLLHSSVGLLQGVCCSGALCCGDTRERRN